MSSIVKKFGLPRLIISAFLISTYIIAPFVDIPITTALSDTIVRFGMNAILVLSLMPMIESGAGLNFGMPLGVEAGLLGATISLQFGLLGFTGFAVAIILGVVFALIFGWAYGTLLNKVKGGEMMIATYVGFSSVAFMCIMWLMLPFTKEDMIWAYGGSGLRTTISVESYWKDILNVAFGKFAEAVPVGEIIFFRKQSVIISTVIAAIGIVVYQQSFGFIQLYLAPFNMAFPAIAAILIGGASVNRVTVWHVIIGTFLFQGILTMTPTVINAVIKTDMSETIRIIVSNGMILYALTRKDGGSRG